MATAMYLQNRDEMAAAAMVLRKHGYRANVDILKINDRYVTNVAARFEPMNIAARKRLEDEIVEEVLAVRKRKRP